MLKRKLIVALLVAGFAASAALPAAARTNVDVIVNFAPPALRHEHVPVLRSGYIWIPGYWDWRGRNYVWINGRKVRDRPGHYWSSAAWVQHDNGWRHRPGGWNAGRRDNDHDGIPNYRDRFPNDRDNDGRPDRRDRFPNDRDNDGRPDGRDRYPDNPRR